MKKFKSYMKDISSFKGLVSKGAVIAPPAAAGFSMFAPPWPGAEVVVGFLISVLELVAVMYIFSIGDRIKDRLDRYLRMMMILVAATLIAYLILFNFLVKPMETPKHLDVIGFVFQKAQFNNYPPEALLKSFGYEPLLIWTGWSVYTSRILILLSWLSFYVSVSCFFGLFHLKSNSHGN